jgi:1-acyl-sn-glycerol-3-phosphate acyltransferase
VASPPIATTAVGTRRRLLVQREVSRLFAPLAFPLIAFALRVALGYRIAGRRELRREYRRICRENDGPLLLCANHLTMIDSFIVAWALGSSWWYLLHFRTLPWNTPERSIFAATPLLRAVVYVLKCLPIERGGDRKEVTEVLANVAFVLSKRESALIFPEAGRSRTGRVEVESAAPGVGRVVRAVPDCRVLCVYLRGDQQQGHSGIPVRGERFSCQLSVVEPKSDHRGLRGSRDISRQITGRLAEMEEAYFHAR